VKTTIKCCIALLVNVGFESANISDRQMVPVRELTGNNGCEVEGQTVAGNAATNDDAVRSGRCIEGNEPGPDAPDAVANNERSVCEIVTRKGLEGKMMGRGGRS
jgi:hypothetical protein